MELPNGKGGKKKTASKRQRAASPAAPTLDGGSPVEGEMAGELLSVPGPSGMCAESSGSMPPAPAEDSAAAVEPGAVEPTVVELVVTELPPAVPAVEPEGVQPEASAVEPGAAAPAAEAVTTVRLVSEALSVLALGLAAAGKPAAGVPTGVPAAVEPAAATVAASAAEPIAAKGEQPVLANGPAAASRECWVLNPVVGPKVNLRKLSVGPAAAVAGSAAARVKCAGEPMSGPELPPANRRSATETESPSTVTASGPIPPTAMRRQSKERQRLV